MFWLFPPFRWLRLKMTLAVKSGEVSANQVSILNNALSSLAILEPTWPPKAVQRWLSHHSQAGYKLSYTWYVEGQVENQSGLYLPSQQLVLLREFCLKGCGCFLPATHYITPFRNLWGWSSKCTSSRFGPRPPSKLKPKKWLFSSWKVSSKSTKPMC